ncbi:PilZ domain-containing protein [Methylobacterium soli]|uniref:PilZ domain-containing protein n=1 Tax=Methylobacterium soli TaxID=553447 RepID=A0A6L3SR05_9HYPH|nr:PilZ domain-containing protein [Methylobacterium soli]
MDEKRAEPRRRALLPGTISLPSGGAIDCLLRDRSSTGARLKVESVIGIPDAFTLGLTAGGEAHPVRVAWRKQHELGVEFLKGTSA